MMGGKGGGRGMGYGGKGFGGPMMPVGMKGKGMMKGGMPPGGHMKGGFKGGFKGDFKGGFKGGFKGMAPYGKGYGRGFGQPQFAGMKRQMGGDMMGPRIVKQKIDPELFEKLKTTESWKLFMGQIPYQATEEKLKELLGKYGEVLRLNILTNETGRSKGCGFVHYKDEASAEKAAAELNGKELPIEGIESRNGKGIVLHLARDAKEKKEAKAKEASGEAKTADVAAAKTAAPAAAEETKAEEPKAEEPKAEEAKEEETKVEEAKEEEVKEAEAEAPAAATEAEAPKEEEATPAPESTPTKAAAPEEDDADAEVEEEAPKTPFKWTTLKVAELKAACAKRGLLNSGKKADLAKRLKQDDPYKEKE